MLSVLPKSEVRNILVAGDKPWKAVAIMGLFVSAIYACAAANAFYNNYPSDWVFYNMGTLAAISLVPISIKNKERGKAETTLFVNDKSASNSNIANPFSNN